MKNNQNISPVFNKIIDFKTASDKNIFFLVPEEAAVIKASFLFQGKYLYQTTSFKDNSSFTEILPVPDENNGLKSNSILIDFHQQRSIESIRIVLKKEEAIDPDKLVCIIRIWGGNQWILPQPKNVLFFKGKGSPLQYSINEGFSLLKTDKIFCSFVKIINPDETDANKDVNIGDSPADDLMELLNFDTLKGIEEQQSLDVASLEIQTKDAIASLTIGEPGKPPLFIKQGELRSEDNKPEEILDFQTNIAKALLNTKSFPVDQLDIPEEFKSYLNPDVSYHPIALSIKTASSGTLFINSIDIGHIFIKEIFSSEPGQTANQISEVNFNYDPMTTRVDEKTIYVQVQEGSTIKKLSFEIKGSINKNRLVPLAKLDPQPDIYPDNISISALANQSLFSSFTVVEEFFAINSIGIRIKPVSDTLSLKALILYDLNGRPDYKGKELASSLKKYESLDGEKYQWLKFELDNQLIPENNTTYWLKIEVKEGEMAWQAEKTSAADQLFVFRQKKEILMPCGPHLDSSLTLIARFFYTPENYREHLSVKIDTQTNYIPLESVDSIDTTLKLDLDTGCQENYFKINLCSESEGKLELSNLKLYYEDSNNPVYIFLNNEDISNNTLTIPDELSRIPLHAISGIGKKYANRLNEAGINNIRDLVLLENHNLPELSSSSGITKNRLIDMVSKALTINLVYSGNLPQLVLSSGRKFHELLEMPTSYLSDLLKISQESAKDFRNSAIILDAATDRSMEIKKR